MKEYMKPDMAVINLSVKERIAIDFPVAGGNDTWDDEPYEEVSEITP